jgi:hypothetical protein
MNVYQQYAKWKGILLGIELVFFPLIDFKLTNDKFLQDHDMRKQWINMWQHVL